MKKKLTPEQKKQKAEYARLWRKRNPEKTAEHAKKSRLKNKTKVKERQKKWREENKEHTLQKSKLWYANNKDRVRDQRLKKEFGISLQDYTKMWIDQDGICKICSSNNPSGKLLAVDHDHLTGKIRGLLCNECSVGIGHLKDDKDLLLKAYYYLKGSK